MKAPLILLFLIIVAANTGCNDSHSEQIKDHPISFKQLEGIHYTEVRRYQQDGLSFNKYGYHLNADWKISFVSDDSISIYSPYKKQYLNLPLTRGRDSVFNAARTYLKVRKMNRDSLLLEMLQVKDDSIAIGGSKIFMKLYSDGFIKNKLHSDTAILKRPNKKDTLFIKSLSAKANTDYKQAFAALDPVFFTSKSPMVKVVKRGIQADMLNNNFSTTDSYMDPTYNVTINNAYTNFYYSFSAYVDNKGSMIYRMPLVGGFGDKDFQDHYIKMSAAIMNSYLKLYLNTTPGSTLGINHASTISLHVQGIAGKK